MNSSSGNTAAAPRFRLRTFGSLALLDSAGGTIVGEHGQQRRRLALLAVLAAAGERGRTRDQLLLLFWPDASQSRARHSLEQLVYAIRSSIGDDVFAGTNPLRLNGAVVRSDVADFNEAIAGDDLETAVQQYAGAFLDGFYLSDAPEFEQWMDAERARLARSYGSALERLAKRAEEAGDHTTAVVWWRRLTDADPVSSTAAIGLMRGLARTGDHAAALRHAEHYESVVGQELGTSAGPEIAAMAAELRTTASAHPLPTSRMEPAAAIATGQRTRSSPPTELTPPVTESTMPVTESTPPVTESTTPVVLHVATRPARRRLVPLLLAFSAVAVLGVVAIVLLRKETSLPDRAGAAEVTAPPSIAVLPLTNLSAAPGDAPIVDGLTEELIGMLSRIEGLRVIARTSAFVFRNSTLDVGQIADSLRVSNVLEGSVQKDGQRLRVQVRLIDARDGSTRWSETYDRELRDIFAVQSEIASAVARELDLRLGMRSVNAMRRPTRSIAAYELYLRGRDPIHFRSADGPRQGLAYLQQAVALDSTFAGAYANMAYMYNLLSGRVELQRTSEFIRLADAAAHKAVTLDPLLPEAHAAVGVTGLLRLRDPVAAESAFKRALKLPGYSRAREHLARLYLYTGRPVEGLAETERAVQEDPLSATAAADLGQALCVNGRYEEGLAQLARLATLQPPLQRIREYIGICHAMRGAWQDVIAIPQPMPPDSADPLGGRAVYGYALARAGRVDEARQRLTELVELRERGRKTAFGIALVHAGLGEYDQAVLWLDRSIDDFSMDGVIMYPLFAELHAHPGFERIRRRLSIQKR